MERETGQTMAEYAVILSLITIAMLVLFQGIGNGAAALIQRLVTAL